MRKFIIILLTCVLPFFFISSNKNNSNLLINNTRFVEDESVKLYADLGTQYFPTNDDDTFTKFRIFVLRKDLTGDDDHQKTLKSVYEYKYKYELHVQSLSKLEGKLVDTYIHNLRIFINGFEISKEQFPEGFWVIISPKGRAIYWYEGNDEIIKFGLKWKGAIFYSKELANGRE